MKKNRIVYLDHAATTPMDPRVVAAMKPYFSAQFENPSALYGGGVKSREAVEDSRKIVADFLGTQPDTIYFTSGGTESTNLAILGLRNKKQETRNKTKGHIITTQIEHHAVLEPIKQLEKEGFEVTYLPVDQSGLVTVEQVEKALREDTVLVSIMYANNEIGTIQPIADIGRMLNRRAQKVPSLGKGGAGRVLARPLFHTDACQATQFLPMKVDALHVDLLSFNGSKIYGPKGSGVLYKRRGVELEPIMYGGGQERGLRSGTEDVPAIVGLAKAIEMIGKLGNKETKKLEKLRDYFWREIQRKINGVKLNGSRIGLSPYQGKGTVSEHSPGRGGVERRLSNNLNISFTDCDAEALILYLDAKGIQCSAGSACTTDSLGPSHVLKACGYSEERAKSSVRFTLGRETTKADLNYTVRVLQEVVKKVRSMSAMSTVISVKTGIHVGSSGSPLSRG
jgi:cysteine desulfurase